MTSYVSPRAQKDANKFKFPIKNEIKKPLTAKTTKPNEKINEENDVVKDIYKEFSEKLSKIAVKAINFSVVLSHFSVENLHFDKNIYYQKYLISQGNIRNLKLMIIKRGEEF